MTLTISTTKTAARFTAVAAAALLVAGCASVDNTTLKRTGVGAGGGALVGAGVGALSGGVSVGGGALGGAAIGAGAGFVYDQLQKENGN